MLHLPPTNRQRAVQITPLRFWALSPLLSFTLAYAALVTLATAVFRFAPAARPLESAHFDEIQSDLAIDSKSDPQFKKYAAHLDQLCFINLDTSLIDPETDRIRKPALARLLRTIAPAARQSQAVLVDYLFQPAGKSAADSLLLAALRELGDRVVVPASVSIEKRVALRGAGSQVFQHDTRVDSSLLGTGLRWGYTNSFADADGTQRFFKFAFDDGSLKSVASLASGGAVPPGNPLAELKFVLRNRDRAGEERAVLTYEAADILSGRLPAAALADLLKNKMVVVGLFEGYETKYGTRIDVFATPTDPQMPGTLLLANAWLNLRADCHLRNSSNWWLIFLLNVLIGSTVKWKFSLDRWKALSSLLNIFVKMGIGLLLFYQISLTFFDGWHIKLSLGMTLFMYGYQNLLWTWWQEQAEFFSKKLGLSATSKTAGDGASDD